MPSHSQLHAEMDGSYKSRKPAGVPQSRSEGNLDFENYRHAHAYGTRVPDSKAAHLRGPESWWTTSGSPVRGRPADRTPSPVKHLQNVDEERAVDFPPSPTKRSRSPHKKRFGEGGWLGRSTSMKELPSEQHKKTGLKHWGEKIKQRVEDFVGFTHYEVHACS